MLAALSPCRFWVAKPASRTLHIGSIGRANRFAICRLSHGCRFCFWLDTVHRANSSHHSALAAARTAWRRVGLLTFYAAGLGLPFLLAALGVSRFLLVSAAVKKHMKWVERSAGVLLVGTGLLIMLGTLQSLATYLLDWFPALGQLG